MTVLDMSLSAAILILAIVIIRALSLHRLPKKTFLVLWGVALCRLLIPFSIPSRFSIYTLADMLKNNAAAIDTPDIVTTVPNITTAVAGTTSVPLADTATAATAMSPITVIWMIGLLACALFFLVTHLRCRKVYKTALPVDNEFVRQWLSEHPTKRKVQIRQSDKIAAPLTYGVFRPVILLPKTTDWTDEMRLRYILTHEFTHIRRFDTLKKLALAAAVCMHWFNPLVWVMYVLANRDIELSCDETVIRTFGETTKSAYALTLIGLEEKKSRLAPLVNNFSKNAIEERIVSIMKIKKTSLIGIIVALALVIGTTTVFATNAARAAYASSGDTNYSDPSNSIIATGATIIPYPVDFGTHMDIELIKGGALTVGRETWEKGDKIIFRISADEDMELYVGILPAESMDSGFGYNDYGFPIDKKVDVGAQEQEASFTVPETGEYGIYVQHIKDETTATPAAAPEVTASDISDEDDNAALLRRLTDNEEKIDSITNTEVQGTVAFVLEINRVFENPLVRSDIEGIPPSASSAATADTAPTASPQNGFVESNIGGSAAEQPTGARNDDTGSQDAVKSENATAEMDESAANVYPVNKYGETYTDDSNELWRSDWQNAPDLIWINRNGSRGYVRREDFFQDEINKPGSPDDEAGWDAYYERYKNDYDIPVYDVNGKTVLRYYTMTRVTKRIPLSEYPVNEYGETYGSEAYLDLPGGPFSLENYPNLIAVVAQSGVSGYARREDLHADSVDSPKSPDDKEGWERYNKLYGSGIVREIPVYEVDGRTVIGTFKIGGGYGPDDIDVDVSGLTPEEALKAIQEAVEAGEYED